MENDFLQRIIYGFSNLGNSADRPYNAYQFYGTALERCSAILRFCLN